MKWLALAAALLAILPVAPNLRRNPQLRLKAWTLVGLLPFLISPLHLYMAVVSWPAWGGYVKGVEVSLLDLLAITLYLGLPGTRDRLPFRWVMIAYLGAVLLSAVQSPVPMATLFYAWQIARIFLVYAVVARASTDPAVVQRVLTGMALGLAFQAGGSLWERVGSGVLQAGGWIGHQNLLGLMTHFIAFPSAALVLAGASGWRPLLGPAAAVVAVVLTVSRATIGLAGAAYAALFAMSAFRAWTARKALLLVVGLCAAAALAPIVLASFEARFSEAPLGNNGYDERAAFELAAERMLADHPMGVGANYYVVAANVLGYNEQAGVATVLGSEGANVHNVYYLVAAETGWIGLMTYILVLLRPLLVAFRCGWGARRDVQGDLLIGLGVALLTVYIHSYFEWIFISFSPQYLFALDVGLVAGVATRLGYWRRSRQPVYASHAGTMAAERI